MIYESELNEAFIVHHSSPEKARTEKVEEVVDQDVQRDQSVHVDTPENDDWKRLFDIEVQVKIHVHSMYLFATLILCFNYHTHQLNNAT